MSQIAVPPDLLAVGYVLGAYGLQGWVRVKPYSSDADALLNVRTWWLDKPQLRDVEMMQAKSHGGDVVARLMGVADRDAAEQLKGTMVKISRSYFPPLPDNEFYWVDLIGLEVVNLQGERLGIVSSLMDNGAHPILTIEMNALQDEKPRECLIPFVEQFVKTVDQNARKITVDWGVDY